MKIVKPSVKLIKQNDINEHIAYCAKVCYGGGEIKDVKSFVEKLKNRKHLSMFRHASVYFRFRRNISHFYDSFITRCVSSPYCSVKFEDNYAFIVTNMQYIIDNSLEDYQYRAIVWYELDDIYEIFKSGRQNKRYTFEIVTQISTARELNRVSPNNISEQSTRYCNYSKGKFGGDVSICMPHWFKCDKNLTMFEFFKFHISDTDEQINIFDISEFGINQGTAIHYLISAFMSSNNYIESVKKGLKSEDARGLLPLDTATKVIYTYTIDEWRHFINLRYYGTTGKPHPNAKIIAGMIKSELEILGYYFEKPKH